MPEVSVELEGLEVVGYADRLTPDSLPRVVPPVFLDERNDQVVLPPFHIEDSAVIDPVLTTSADFEHLLDSGNATRLPDSFRAKPDHILWIDEKYEAHYQPAAKAQSRLRNYAQHQAREALEALENRNTDKALELANRAITADNRCLNSVLITALAYKIRGDRRRVTAFRRVANMIDPGIDFDSWLDMAARGLERSTPASSGWWNKRLAFAGILVAIMSVAFSVIYATNVEPGVRGLDARIAELTDKIDSMERTIEAERSRSLDLESRIERIRRAESYFALGMEHLYKKDYENALSAFEKAFHLDPDQPLYLAEKVKALGFDGRSAELTRAKNELQSTFPEYYRDNIDYIERQISESGMQDRQVPESTPGPDLRPQNGASP